MNVGQKRGRKITTLCSLLGYSRQALYQQVEATEHRILGEELIIQQVLRIRERQKRVGTRKLLLMLKPFLLEHKLQMGRDGLFALLNEHNLLVRKRKSRIPRTTCSNHWMKKYPNLIVGMAMTAPDKLWVSDITYITLRDDFAYLSLITDAYSRMIMGYYLSRNLQTEGCLKALKMAIKQLPPGSMLIHHSDRGSQYCSFEYVEQLLSDNISISMTQNGDPRENAIAERVNGIIKQEFLLATYDCFEDAGIAIKEAIDIYNHERRHSSIDMLTPFEAHTMTGELKRHWKNYYANKQKEVIMT
jgi:transposase InsO family protein